MKIKQSELNNLITEIAQNNQISKGVAIIIDQQGCDTDEAITIYLKDNPNVGHETVTQSLIDYPISNGMDNAFLKEIDSTISDVLKEITRSSFKIADNPPGRGIFNKVSDIVKNSFTSSTGDVRQTQPHITPWDTPGRTIIKNIEAIDSPDILNVIIRAAEARQQLLSKEVPDLDSGEPEVDGEEGVDGAEIQEPIEEPISELNLAEEDEDILTSTLDEPEEGEEPVEDEPIEVEPPQDELDDELDGKAEFNSSVQQVLSMIHKVVKEPREYYSLLNGQETPEGTINYPGVLQMVVMNPREKRRTMRVILGKRIGDIVMDHLESETGEPDVAGAGASAFGAMGERAKDGK